MRALIGIRDFGEKFRKNFSLSESGFCEAGSLLNFVEDKNFGIAEKAPWFRGGLNFLLKLLA